MRLNFHRSDARFFSFITIIVFIPKISDTICLRFIVFVVIVSLKLVQIVALPSFLELLVLPVAAENKSDDSP